MDERYYCVQIYYYSFKTRTLMMFTFQIIHEFYLRAVSTAQVSDSLQINSQGTTNLGTNKW